VALRLADNVLVIFPDIENIITAAIKFNLARAHPHVRANKLLSILLQLRHLGMPNPQVVIVLQKLEILAPP
jgi:hypothetical protein